MKHREIELPSPTELHWLAGILEGEGSFMMSRNTVRGKVYLYPKITVNMTDRDIIERVATLFGTGVYDLPLETNFPNRKYQFRAQVTGTPAAQFMELLLPIMGNRRSEKITEILTQYRDRPDPNELRREASRVVASTRKRSDKGQFV